MKASNPVTVREVSRSRGAPQNLTCHSLRHAIATHLPDASVSLEFVKDHLGHQSIRSTSISARITDQHRVAVFRELARSPWIVQPGVGTPDHPITSQPSQEALP